MKFRTTKKAINGGYKKVINVGYCRLSNLLTYQDPIAYTERAEGWAADVYEVEGVALVTGYAPFGNIKPSYELCKKYDAEAEEIYENNKLNFNEQVKKLDELLNKFINLTR